ncbi:MAG: dTDP-glucose 4,6-dehydratase [Bdellovibrionaceae bacterium]|nr:dTDP-glucose 4,6-dehydratase [Pseudobdellovibrionaceae bacterium]
MGRCLLVTGGAGFIGSQFVRIALDNGYRVINFDALTYAGHLANLNDVEKHPEYCFIHADIRDRGGLRAAMADHHPDGIVHFAAESHVDNSIHGPQVFLETNIMGTFSLLETAREYSKLSKKAFRFLHVSTDEVFGELGPTGKFSETTAYSPNSPYSASKASSDHLVRAWHHTYGLETIITNCSNNYGPRQFPEKLIPRMILNAIEGKPLPIYGKGENIRDWIHVEDHARGVLQAFENGQSGQTYCLGGNSERKNVEVVHSICEILDRKMARADGRSYKTQIEFVSDRLGHDFRYAIDDRKAANEIGFKRRFDQFEDGLASTIDWYLKADEWLAKLRSRNSAK